MANVLRARIGLNEPFDFTAWARCAELKANKIEGVLRPTVRRQVACPVSLLP